MYLPRLQNVGFDKSATEIKYDGIVIAAIKLKYCMLAGAFPTHSFFPTILPVFYQLFFLISASVYVPLNYISRLILTNIS